MKCDNVVTGKKHILAFQIVLQKIEEYRSSISSLSFEEALYVSPRFRSQNHLDEHCDPYRNSYRRTSSRQALLFVVTNLGVVFFFFFFFFPPIDSFQDLTIESLATTIDIHNLLYLHPFAVQGVTLVPQMLTGSENYTTWSRSIRLALRGKNKLGFIEGTDTHASETKYPDLWDRCNAVVLSWLLNSVKQEIASRIFFSKDAHLVWVDLKERYHKVDGTKAYSLLKSMLSLLQGTLSVARYFT